MRGSYVDILEPLVIFLVLNVIIFKPYGDILRSMTLFLEFSEEKTYDIKEHFLIRIKYNTFCIYSTPKPLLIHTYVGARNTFTYKIIYCLSLAVHGRGGAN